jgi:hypothetical protein
VAMTVTVPLRPETRPFCALDGGIWPFIRHYPRSGPRAAQGLTPRAVTWNGRI